MGMKFVLQRIAEVDSNGTPGVTGEITGAAFPVLTLEHKSVICAAGTYPLIPGVMVSHGDAPRAELTGVPGRSGIFIHSANEASQLEGCIGVGDTRPSPGILGGGILHGVAARIYQMVKDNPNSTIEIRDIVANTIPEAVTV